GNRVSLPAEPLFLFPTSLAPKERLHIRFDNRQYYLPYEDLRLTASPEPSYEDPRLTRFTCTMLKILCKPF
ncbi:unnamed protein product, partial [Brassica rapa subsp. trilocularis]